MISLYKSLSMRIFTLLCILLNYQAFSQLQIPSFSAPLSISRPGWIEYIDYGNINGDDYLDVVFTTYEDPHLYYALGTSSKGFDAVHRIPLNTGNTYINYHPVNLTDLNDDGIDEVVIYANSGYLAVFTYEEDAFQEPTYILLSVTNQVQRIGVADLDNNGTQEILLTYLNLDYIQILKEENNGYTHQNIDANLGYSGQLEIIDFNNDQKLDILVPDLNNNNLKLFEGDGSLNFVLAKTLNFESPVVGFSVANLSGDSLYDIVAIPNNSLVIKLFTNLGDYNFSETSIPVDQYSPVSKGIAIGDVNVDGRNDIMLGFGVSVAIMENISDNVFTKNIYPVGSLNSTDFIRYIDVNSDNNVELLVAGSTLGVFSFEGNEPVLDSKLPTSSNLHEGKFADLNGDGALDIISASATTGFVEIYYRNSLGNVSYSDPVFLYAGVQPNSIDVGDFNNDNKPDILFSTNGSSPPQRIGIFLSNPANSTFNLEVIREVHHNKVVSGDFDADGNLDFVAVNEIFYGTGDGTFEPVTFGSGNYLYQFDVGNLNNDNYLDIVEFQSSSGEVLIHISNAERSYNEPIILSPSNLPSFSVYTLSTFDFTNDDLSDIVVTGGGFISLFTNNGDGSFTESFKTLPEESHVIVNLKEGDLNKDEHTDFVVATSYQNLYVYIGDGTGFEVFEDFTEQNNDSFLGLEIVDINNDTMEDIVSFSGSNPYVINSYLNKTAIEPTVPPSEFVFSEKTDGSFVVNVTPGNGDGIILIVSRHETLPNLPSDPSFYQYSQGYGAGAEISPDAYVCYIGTHQSQHIQLLQKNTTYYVHAFEYNTNYDESEFNYLTSHYAVGMVTTKDTQVISVEEIPALPLDSPPYTVDAEASSSLPVTIEVVSGSITVDGLNISPINAGPVEIILKQAGNDNFMPAESVTRIFCVLPLVPIVTSQQTEAGHTLTSSSPINNEWYVNSELISGEIQSSISISESGSYTVLNNFNGCTQTSEPLVIKDQTITFETIPAKEVGQSDFQLVASSTSTLPVSFRSESTLISINGTSASILAPGSVTIEAYQDGSNVFTKAEPVFQIFCVNPPKPIIQSVEVEDGYLLTSSSVFNNQWLRNNVPIEGETNQTFLATENDSYSVLIQFDNCSSVSDPMELIVTSIENEIAMQLWPNPVVDLLNINFAERPKRITARDTQGKLFELPCDSQIDLQHLSRGVYFLKLEFMNSIHYFKFIKL